MTLAQATPPTDVVAKYLWSLWRQGRQPDVHNFLRKAGNLPPAQVLAVLRVDQQERWRTGERPLAAGYLQAQPKLLDCPDAYCLLHNEIQLRREQGETVAVEEYCAQFPYFAERLRAASEQQQQLSGPVTRAIPYDSSAVTPKEDAFRPERGSPTARGMGESEAPVRGAPTSEAAGRATTVAEPEAVPKPLTVPPPQKSVPRVPGYDILAELGRGGMGVVYKARHHALGRLVALKMLRSTALADDAELARFRAESKVLARLQHANIVQIFEVGEYESDPFFAVEFVDGGDLASKLRTQLPQPSRAALVAEKLAEAIHYAHQQGVIHRDLKPANILLAADGSPKIADFGLAKRVDATKRRTETGAIFGTPYYMAPEQAEGLTHEVGPTADIYALGAILYEMLTGRPPFRAATVLETLELVRYEEPVPPRQLQPGVSRDLETICLKCLQKEAAKRYATGQELAADLERYRKREPILARPVSRAERTWRWCRRNPLVASLLIALAVTIAGAFTAITALWLQARQERAQALANFRTARDAIDRYFTQVSEDRDLKVRGAEPLRKRLLESAKEFYSQLALQHANDSELQTELARANARLAWITALTASSADALHLYQEAAAQLLALAGTPADSTPVHRDLARIYLAQAELLYDLGRLNEAEKVVQTAVDLRTQIAQAQPDWVNDQLDLAAAYYAQSLVRIGALRMAEAEKELRLALELLDRLEDRAGSSEPYLVLRARCYLGLAARLTERAERREPAPLLQQALALWERLSGADPANHPYGNELAMTCVQLAALEIADGRPAAAAELFDRALNVVEPLARTHPTINDYQYTLALVHQGRGALFLAQKRGADADAAFNQAVTILERLKREQPNNVRTLLSLAQLFEKRCEVYKFLGQLDKAQTYLEQAVAAWDSLARINATNPVFLFFAAKSHFDAHVFYQQLPGQMDKVIAESRRSAELMETLLKEGAAEEEYVQFCANVEIELGILLLIHGRASDAEAPMRKGVEMHERMAKSKPSDAGRQQQFAIACIAWTKACHANKRTADAQAAEQKAVDAFDAYIRAVRASAPGPEAAWPPDFKHSLADAYALAADQLQSIYRHSVALGYWEQALEFGAVGQRPQRARMRALSLALVGRHRDATAAADALSAASNASGDDHYQLARVYAYALRAVSNDMQLSQVEQAQLIEQYGTKVMAALVRAHKAGYFQNAAARVNLKKDALFQGVRARSDFPKELEAGP